jgi:FkbM family methyltransferase
MANVRPGDKIADVGAYIGLYTVALARRVGPAGKVTAFEPNKLKSHLHLNKIDDRVDAVNVAVGARDGLTSFSQDKDSQNQIVSPNSPNSLSLPLLRLDTHFRDAHLDLLKIDVEGFEEDVLRGSENLLADRARAPRRIYIEVHPYNWHLCGTTSESLLDRLRSHNYEVRHMDGAFVRHIENYGEIVTRRMDLVKA